MRFAVILFLLLPNLIQAQAPSIEWQTYIDDIDPLTTIFANDVFNTDEEGNLYIGGVTGFLDDTTPRSEEDVVVYKFSPSGDQLWRSQFGSIDEDFVRCLVEWNEGNTVVVGASRTCEGLGGGDCLGGIEAWVTMLGKDGMVLRTKSFSGSEDDFINEVLVLSDRSIVVTGGSLSTDGFFADRPIDKEHFVAKLDPDLNLTWMTYFDGLATDIALAANGNIVLCGALQPTGNTVDNDAWIRVANEDNGTIVSERIFAGNAGDGNCHLVLDEDFIYLGLVSESQDGIFSANFGADDYFLIKLDYDLDEIWVKNYGGAGADGFNSISFDSTGDNIIMCGHTRSSGGDIVERIHLIDPWLIKLDKEDGELLWSETYDIREIVIGTIHLLGRDGSIYVRTLAFVEEVTLEASIPALVKLSTPIDSSELSSSTIELSAHPNPIKDGGLMNLRSEDLVGRLVDMSLYDVYGRELWQVEDFNFIQAEMSISLQKNLASGTYYLSVRSGDSERVLPIVIVGGVD